MVTFGHSNHNKTLATSWRDRYIHQCVSVVLSLDDGSAVGLQAGLQLLQDLAALGQLWGTSVWEGQVVDGEPVLAVGLQEPRHAVALQLSTCAEHKHILHTLLL